MNRKRILLLAIVFALGASLYAPPAANAANTDDSFYQELGNLLSSQDDSFYFDTMELSIGSNILSVDGETQTLDVIPEITNNRTMLPIRAIAETAGATVEWDQATATVLIESAYGDEISCTIGESAITVNEETSELDVAAYVKDGRTFLPVRAVAEALDMDVEWVQESASVLLTSPYQSARVIASADRIDTSGLNATTVLNDGNGLWVMQFSTPADAKVAAALLQSMGIEAEPDRYIPPIDDGISAQAAAQASGNASWGAADCGFPSYINNYSSRFTGREVVAVLDTGVDATHSLLRGRVLNGYDFVDGDSNPSDENSHGTLVSGVIIDCVGSSPVSILPVRVMNSKGSGTSSAIAAGIRYAVANGADVINLSLGGEGHSYVMEAAIDYAVSSGVAVVVAAGNSNQNTANECPAHITTAGVLVASAGNSNHNKANFSNYGNSVDLMAPGVNVNAATLGNTYRLASGTSFAAPHVSAATALIDLAWRQDLSTAELENKVRAATTYGVWTNQSVGCGFLDLSKAEAPSAVAASISLSHSNLSLMVGESFTLSATASPSTAVVSWSSDNTSVATVSGNGQVTVIGSGTSNITASITVNGQRYSASCAVTARAPSFSLSRHSLSLVIGNTETLSASTSISGASVSWSSSNTAVATVDNSGKVTAISAGTAAITAVFNYSGSRYSDSCTVSVSATTPTLSGDWTTDHLTTVPGYTIETKTQYRSRTKQTTTSTQSSLLGWTLYDQTTAYGNWSEWSDWRNGQLILLNNDDSREIENRSYETGRTKYYELYYYKYWNTNHNTYYYTYASSMGGTKYTTTALASDCTPYRSYDGHQAYTHNGHNLWWIERAYENISFANEHRERTREKIITYYYYQWGAWSEWADGTAQSNDNLDVETRTLYRYVAQ